MEAWPVLLPCVGRRAVSIELHVLPFVCCSLTHSLHARLPLHMVCPMPFSHPCHTSFHSSSPPQSLLSVTSHVQFPFPCSISCSSLLAWLIPGPSQLVLVQCIPTSTPVHQRSAPYPLIPTHTLWVLFALTLHCFLVQTQ